MTGWPWPAPADDGGARHLVRRYKIPDVALPTTAGREVSFARMPGRTVVFFYPWTGRPGLPDPPGWDEIPGAHGSTPEAEGFRSLFTAFERLDTAVFGVSTQGIDHQRELVERLALPFAIASDAGLAFSRALALPTFETGGTTFLKRLTLVILDGRIEHLYYPVHPPDAHAREVLAWLGASVGYALESRLRKK